MTKVFRKEEFRRIVNLLKKEEIVAFPTDTVFGIGVIYNSRNAVEKMKLAKGRDAAKPFPLMVADESQLEEVAWLNERDLRIVRKLTPGALTLVLKRKDAVEADFVNGFDTIAVRIPDDEFVLKLLRKVGPMFVTSANLSGCPSANNDSEVLQQLDGRIAAVVIGEAKSHVASTIIDCTGEELRCLRQGDITLQTILEAANEG